MSNVKFCIELADSETKLDNYALLSLLKTDEIKQCMTFKLMSLIFVNLLQIFKTAKIILKVVLAKSSTSSCSGVNFTNIL